MLNLRIAVALLLFTAWGCSYSGSNGDGGSGDADGQCRGDPPGAWEAYDFTFHPASTSCAGDRYVRLMPGYNLWVGAILCDADQYKLFLAEEKAGTFYQIGRTTSLRAAAPPARWVASSGAIPAWGPAGHGPTSATASPSTPSGPSTTCTAPSGTAAG
jgi:hypothetical protein